MQQQRSTSKPSSSQLCTSLVKAKAIFRTDLKSSKILADWRSNHAVLLLLLNFTKRSKSTTHELEQKF